MRVFALTAVVAAALAAVDFVSPMVLAQDVAPATPEEEAPGEEGTLIQIGPEGDVGVDVQVDGLRDRRERRLERRLSRQPGLVQPPFGQPPAPVSRYWIGIGGGVLPPEVRAQLTIPAEEGVLIRSVAPESPAAEAGVELYDVVVRANGEPVNDLVKLAEIVGKQGEAGEALTLDLLRRGQPVQLTVTPIERPIDELTVGPQRRGLFGPEGVFGPEGILGGEGFPFGDAPFAGAQPGAVPNAGELLQMLPQMATGVSVSVSRENDGPAKVTVQSGDKTWEFEEGDDDALAALPDDVRQVVERMLTQNGGALPPGFEGFGLNAPGVQMQLNGEGLAARMRALQERMQALQGQLGGGQLGGGPPADPDIIEIEPQDNLDEAPAFGAEEPTKAEVEGPTEIEIPAKDSD